MTLEVSPMERDQCSPARQTRRAGGLSRLAAAPWQGTVIPAISVAVAVLIWIGLSYALPRHPIVYLPPPWAVAHAFGEVGSVLPSDIEASVEEALGGWIVGSAGAIVIGILLARIRLLDDLMRGVIEVLRPISPIAWAPMGIVWLGTGYAGKAFLVALISFFLVVLPAYHGAHDLDPLLIKVADDLSLRGWRRFRVLTLMSALPQVFVGLRLALAGAWGGVIVAEIVAGSTDRGLGALEFFASQGGNVPQILVGVATISIIGLAASWLLALGQRKIVRWVPAR
jgi:ABC-type nitrate/sulfonate/bicarbonate transport system permease component